MGQDELKPRKKRLEPGDQFGALTAVKPLPKQPGQTKVYWDWQCVCGRIKSKRATDVTGGKITSCGCGAHSHAATSATMQARPAEDRIAKASTAGKARWAKARIGKLTGDTTAGRIVELIAIEGPVEDLTKRPVKIVGDGPWAEHDQKIIERDFEECPKLAKKRSLGEHRP